MDKLNIFLDIDDVVLSWNNAYAERFNTRIPKGWSKSKLMSRRLNILSKEKDYWLNIPVKNVPNFQPKGFVSARGIPKAWTKESLKRNKIPGRSNVHQVNWGESKVKLLKSLGCEIFIDDKPETFRECNKNGIFCLLMDASTNQKVRTDLRIYDLDIDNIMRIYHKYFIKL